MKITSYTPDKACEIADLFYQAVQAVDTSVYSEAQKAVWAPLPVDYTFWAARLAVKQPFLAIKQGRVAGFIELEADGHIDCLYTHPCYQRQGVAAALYAYLESEAEARHLRRLYVEASCVAQSFFSTRGFRVIRENHLQRQGVSLINTLMEKRLRQPS